MPNKNIAIESLPGELSVIYGSLLQPIDTIPLIQKKLEAEGIHKTLNYKDNQRDLNPHALLSNSGRMALHPRDLRRIDQAIVFIEKNYADHISPESLSVEVELSVPKLQAGLKKKTGYSLYRYHEQARITVAKSMLEGSDKPLRVIARAVGFKTHSHFGEIFKKITAMTPSEYRNQYGC